MFDDIDSFLQELFTLKNKFFSDADIEIKYKRIDKVSLRIFVTPAIFIDIYANTDTMRYDFSVIKDSRRAYGYDNLGGWHYHPSDKPDDHINCSEPSLDKIFKEIYGTVNRIK